MMDETYRQSFSRNIGILTEDEQERLSRATVAIAGMGGIGGNTLTLLARSGVGNFHITDFDHFDLVNINRQYGARVSTRGQPKCDVLAAEARDISPSCYVKILPQGFNSESAEDFLRSADIVVDAIDFFAIEPHIELHREARRHGLSIVMGSPVGFSACLQVFSPDGMSLEEYCAIKPEMMTLEKQLRYCCGLVPALLHIDYFDVSAGASNTDFLKRAGPSLGVACALAAALVATEVVLILLGRRKPRVIPHTFQFDPYTFKYEESYVEGGMKNYDPGPAIRKVRDKSSFVPQVLDLFFRRKRSERASVDGGELAYQVEGEGKPVLLICPLGADVSFWSRQVPELARYFRVITFDNRGSGMSSPCADDCSTEVMARDAIALLDHLKIDSAHLVGLALGGLIAQQVAARRPDLVDRLVLTSTYLRADDLISATTSRWRRIADTQGMERLFDVCLEWLFSPQYIAENEGELARLKTFYRLTLQDPRCFCRQSLAGVAHDARGLVERITRPALVVHGGGDRLVDPQLGRALAECLPNSEFIVLETAPHFLVWEQSKQFNNEVIKFLGSPDGFPR